jgi:hypothetical protein
MKVKLFCDLFGDRKSFNSVLKSWSCPRYASDGAFAPPNEGDLVCIIQIDGIEMEFFPEKVEDLITIQKVKTILEGAR